MPDTRKHRGSHPEDKKLFDLDLIPKFRLAFHDFCWLLDHNYPTDASLKIVADKFRFKERQRKALMRTACTEGALNLRKNKELMTTQMEGQSISIDTHNQLITMESILSGALLLKGRDGCIRDLASLHGSYRRVEETVPALIYIGECLQKLKILQINWYIDAPISNSGRLKQIIYSIAEEKSWNWHAEVVNNPDKDLARLGLPVISSDSWIIEQATNWFNLTQYILDSYSEDYWLYDFT